jgi:hypothetical protein
MTDEQNPPAPEPDLMPPASEETQPTPLETFSLLRYKESDAAHEFTERVTESKDRDLSDAGEMDES